jgi:predicted AAA+ superfamily ATPase
MLNKSDVARDVGVSVKAVGDWLSVLQASGQIILLEPWFTSFAKRIVKTPKVYFRDSGLLCFLLNLDEASLGSSSYLGAVWETLVFAEMRKINQVAKHPVNLWYYRDQRAREIDFVLERGGRLGFVECKWREHPDTTDARHLLAVREELAGSGTSWKPGPSWLIGTPEASYPMTEGLTAGAIRDLPSLFAMDAG